MLVIVSAAAHPVQIGDVVRNGDFWHGIPSSQQSREATYKDGQHQKKNLLGDNFWQLKNLLKFQVDPFTFLEQNTTCHPAATDIFGRQWDKEEFCRRRVK